ncbi:MAG: M48 family metallopeptidase, partial [Alphaproteobacteria bacterium]
MAYKARCLKLFLPVFAGLAMLAALPAQAQRGEDMILIRDAEIESTLKEWLAPLVEAAGMSKDRVNIVLVQSPQINAFVAGGSNIFLFTGLIEKTRSPGELIGVMAHELGHISGGHLIAGRQAMERASYESILGAVIGMGTMVAGGGGAGQAIIAGSNNMAMRSYLTHSRVQESSADHAALRFFETAQMDPGGFATFFETMESQELLPIDQQNEYMRTHPLTRDRIGAAVAGAQKSAFRDKGFPPEWNEQHARMKAKLMGFMSPGQVAWTYADSDKS